jgi:CHAD domain-containing protein
MAEDNEDTANLGFQTPFHDAAAAVTSATMDEIEKQWGGALSGEDVEAIHDLRVASRRLRAALSVYEDAFPAKEFRRAEKAMAQLTDALGPARDTDVLIEHLQKEIESLEPGREAEKTGLERYVRHLEAQRREQQILLDHAMRRLDLEKLSRDLDSVRAPHLD